MRHRRNTKLPIIAKYGIVAMLLADGVGIYLAHNKINQVPMSGMEESAFALAEPVPVYSEDGLQAPRSLASADAPAARNFDKLPPLLELKPVVFEPIDVAPTAPRDAELAERAPVAPSVRIAALRPIRRDSRLFTTAFARDISGPGQLTGPMPEVGFARLPTVNVAVEPGSVSYDEARINAEAPSAEVLDATVPDQPTEPALAPDTGIDAQPAPVAPSGGPEAELPPS